MGGLFAGKCFPAGVLMFGRDLKEKWSKGIRVFQIYRRDCYETFERDVKGSLAAVEWQVII